MKTMFLKLLLLSLWHLVGAFGDYDEMKYVKKGDSVTLNSDLTEMKDDDVIQWRFGNTLIAEINKQDDRFTVYDDVLDGRFRDRLKLNKQTGSLTITNTRTEHEGNYELETNSMRKSFTLTVIVKISVKEGDSVTLNSDLTEMKDDDLIQWRFGNTLIAEINKQDDRFTVYDDVLDGRFRDRLKLDNQTGSLTITNITMKHAGDYELLINNVRIYFRLTVIVSVTEGDSVTLNSDLTEMKNDDQIQWMFNKTLIAEINKQKNRFTVYDDVLDGRFRDRLKMHNQTGSLTITNTRTEHAGVYKLQINNVRKRFNLTVYARLPVPVISRNSSQCSSSSSSNCSLVCSAVNVGHVTLSWYKGNSLLSSISVSDLSISLSLPLEVEYQDKNTYSCVLNNPFSNQTQHLDITHLCHTCAVSMTGLISAAAAGSLLIVAAVGIFCICKKCRKTDQEVETREEEITYVEAIFHKRKAQKLDHKEEDHVEYASVANRR
ncbi:T-lymphocyte surface antigen Ly-9-like [Chanodichthys erythropterus]|uniref:T-lymphocyte surface antigen Ly-9-like n=1 Tax=Chanodichthys erythropterus TaxID=933992 RepID=UPI00351E7938